MLLSVAGIPYNACYQDSEAIEVTSAPLESWKEFIAWNKSVRSAASKVKWTPEIDWLGGGMGHHHIDFQPPAVLDNLFRIVAERPYLAWVFVHPSDKKNAVSLASWYIDLCEMKNHPWWASSNSLAFRSDVFKNKYPLGRGNVLTIRNHGNTIEWRGFDAAVDMKMQVEHTAFLQALVGYAKRTAKTVKRAKLFTSNAEAKEVLHVHASSFKRCEKGFYELLKILGLPKSRYESYVETNLITRLEWKNAI